MPVKLHPLNHTTFSGCQSALLRTQKETGTQDHAHSPNTFCRISNTMTPFSPHELRYTTLLHHHRQACTGTVYTAKPESTNIKED